MDEADNRSRNFKEFLRTNKSNDPFSTAVHATRMPMIISNPHENDNPIIFANDAFLKLIGYGREEILGKNCRFLQGHQTDRAEIGKLKSAIEDLTPIEIELLNYKKNGDQFWNKLFVSPVFDRSGILSFFFCPAVSRRTWRF